jgi:hypothetical protein
MRAHHQFTQPLRVQLFEVRELVKDLTAGPNPMSAAGPRGRPHDRNWIGHTRQRGLHWPTDSI